MRTPGRWPRIWARPPTRCARPSVACAMSSRSAARPAAAPATPRCGRYGTKSMANKKRNVALISATKKSATSTPLLRGGVVLLLFGRVALWLVEGAGVARILRERLAGVTFGAVAGASPIEHGTGDDLPVPEARVGVALEFVAEPGGASFDGARAQRYAGGQAGHQRATSKNSGAGLIRLGPRGRTLRRALRRWPTTVARRPARVSRASSSQAGTPSSPRSQRPTVSRCTPSRPARLSCETNWALRQARRSVASMGASLHASIEHDVADDGQRSADQEPERRVAEGVVPRQGQRRQQREGDQQNQQVNLAGAQVFGLAWTVVVHGAISLRALAACSGHTASR